MSIPSPSSVAEISQLISQLDAGRQPVKLGRTALNTLRKLAESPAKTAVSSISELAESHQVNPSTISRLAKTLGFSGFSAFQKIFRDHVDRHGNYYSYRASRLLDSYANQDVGGSALDIIIKDEMANLDVLRKIADRTVLESVVDMTIEARKVGFFGRRQFYSLAAFMGYALGLVRKNVELLQPIPDTAHSLNYMDENDLLFVLGVDPYTSTTVDACEIARQLSIPLVAMTDSPESPLAKYAFHHLLIPTDGQFYSNSMAASFVMAEGLLSMVAQRLGDDAISNLERREKLNREFGTTLN